MRFGRWQSRSVRGLWAALALAALTSFTALGECSKRPDAPCVLPLISIPPALGVRVQGGVVAGTMGFSLGLFAGPHLPGVLPPVLMLVDLGAAYVPPSLLESWLRLSASWLFSLGEVLSLGPGLSACLPDFNVLRLAGGLAGTVLLRFGGIVLRLAAQVELSMLPLEKSVVVLDGETLRFHQTPSPPVFSVALGVIPR